ATPAVDPALTEEHRDVVRLLDEARLAFLRLQAEKARRLDRGGDPSGVRGEAEELGELGGSAVRVGMHVLEAHDMNREGRGKPRLHVVAPALQTLMQL